MKARVKWIEGMAFLGESGSGHAVVMDGAPEYGGKNLGPRPMEMLLLGLGGCTAFDVVLILKKGRHPVEDCQVEMEAERAETDPKVFTKIHMRYLVKGRGLKPEAVERAVGLSAEKYCSATHILNKTAEITHEIVIEETA
ncbi:MAG: OsmC family protein [Alphaproteobacteria bacterium]|nr:OsmC family protein [Alphaproteobacteria bacterium]MBU0798003.1 OsmC family protein [Alphaproteobacteria bacterium]MBU0886221.1 OsmC family protein [Alphaproteobacteria bacterium]MBU1814194.1 OsmC family protein [Alphaproteobacteria bacterium]MBU2091854.1 OsmC family protein [Alphaproteobacteria bacterium]